MSTLLLTANEQTLAELQVESFRSWEGGLPKPSLWQREPAQAPSAGFLGLRLPDPLAFTLLEGKEEFNGSFIPPHYFIWVHFELIVVNNGHLQRLGREEGKQAYVLVVWEALRICISRWCWKQYFSSPWGIQACSSDDQCFSLHDVVLNTTYLKVGFLSAWNKRLVVLSLLSLTVTSLRRAKEK